MLVSTPFLRASVQYPFRHAPRCSFLPIFFYNRQNAQLIESFVHALPSELRRSGPLGCCSLRAVTISLARSLPR